MKMKRVVTLSLTLVLVVATVALVSAQGGDSVTHNTSWTFQNLGDQDAQVHVDLYDTTGTRVAMDDFTVADAESFWAPAYAPLDPVGSFNGSIVASSSERLASIANQVAVNSSANKTGNATYMGLSAEKTAPTVFAPVVMKAFAGLFWTELSIQSTATSGSTMVDVHYFQQDGTEVSGSPVSYSVSAGSATRVAQADEAILPSNFNGSAMVEAQDGTTDLALVVNEYYGTANHMYNQFYSYEGFASGSTEVVLPATFINGYGGLFQASTSVQNLNGPASPATVTWRFYDTSADNPDPGTEIHSFTEVITTSKSVYFPDEPYAETLMDAYNSGDDEWVGSVTLESSEPLVAIVNETSGSFLAASYTGLMGGSDELNFPLALIDGYGFANTSYSISDVSGTAGDVEVTVQYIADTTQCPGCSNESLTYTFNNTDSKYQPDHIPATAMSNGVFVGSVQITVNTPGKVINGIMNETLGGATQDNFTSFNAFTTP